jgi:leader peptidase (prepilin peptidase) / N-methyltransferase
MRAFLFGLAGLICGSFLTGVTHRVPLQQSIALRSACPHCGFPVLARDKISLVSYVLRRGRCRHCRSHISAEYPAIEAVTAALFVATALVFRPLDRAVLAAPFLGVMVAAAVIDAHHRIIPNRLVYPSLLLFAAAITGLSLAGGNVDVVTGLLGLLVFGGGLFIVAFVSPRGMGMGDVKLAALIGLVLGALGWTYLGVAAMTGLLAGGVGGMVMLLMGRSRRDTLPFGPYLAGGAVLAALAGPQILDAYVRMVV